MEEYDNHVVDLNAIESFRDEIKKIEIEESYKGKKNRCVIHVLS